MKDDRFLEKPTTKRDTSWEAMYEALVVFRKENGHCNVSLNDAGNPALGRWVATQRFRRKINSLSPDRVRRLKEIGFVWSVSEASWEQMFSELVKISKKVGHCNIPAKWPENCKLATWVSNQRHKRKKGRLSRERIRRLNEIGFTWSAWSASESRKKRRIPADHPPDEPAPSGKDDTTADHGSGREIPRDCDMSNHTEEKLYNLAPDVYVQHNDHDEKIPVELAEYIAGHNGEWPAYIPLPDSPVKFLMGNPFMVKRRGIHWSGHGPLDPEIIEYVRENGVLPEWKQSQ